MTTAAGAAALGTDLFHFAQVQCILVMCSELHEAHVRALRQLRDALDARKESKEQSKSNERISAQSTKL